MAQERSSTREAKRTAAAGQARRRPCYFCGEKLDDIDWKNTAVLRRFMSEKGKLRPRRVTGSCRRHQVQVGAAVKRAREMALLPYAGR